MGDGKLVIALITKVCVGDGAEHQLKPVLRQAKSQGAELAVLPELPFNEWVPVSKTARDEDAEPPWGPRHTIQAEAARGAGLGLIGGAIVRDPQTGRRYNTALVFNDRGELIATHRKLHIPEEEGFWETSHYEPGSDIPSVVHAFGMSIGIQLCSDVNRPEGCHVLGALGAEAIIVPRATPQATYERWRLVLRANAVTSTTYVVSVNRPGDGFPVGGPSVVVAPDGTVVLETTEAFSIVSLDRSAVLQARRSYPGYLPVRAHLYAAAWEFVLEQKGTDPDEDNP